MTTLDRPAGDDADYVAALRARSELCRRRVWRIGTVLIMAAAVAVGVGIGAFDVDPLIFMSTIEPGLLAVMIIETGRGFSELSRRRAPALINALPRPKRKDLRRKVRCGVLPDDPRARAIGTDLALRHAQGQLTSLVAMGLTLPGLALPVVYTTIRLSARLLAGVAVVSMICLIGALFIYRRGAKRYLAAPHTAG